MVVQLLHGSDTQLGLTQGLWVSGTDGGLLGQRAGGQDFSSPQPAAVALGLRRGGPHGSCPSAPGFSPIVGYGLITVLSFLVMGVSTLFTVTILAAMQGRPPPDLLGKVMATVLATANCAQPLGQAVYGLLFEGLATTPGQ